MTDRSSAQPSRRASHIEETVLEVDGVVGVRVWELPDRVEIGLLVAASDAASDVLKRVGEVTDAMRAPDEVWEVGLLNDLEPLPTRNAGTER